MTVGTATLERRRGFFQKRFMRSMSVGKKLWLTTGILALPLLALSVFYVKSLSATVGFTAAEQRGLLLCKPLRQIARRLGRHAELDAASFVHHSGAPAETQQLFGEIDEQLAKFDALDSTYGSANTHALAQTLKDKWTALKTSKPAIVEESLMRHVAVLDAVFTLREAISADLKVGLDPEVASYNTLDVALAKLPQAERYLSETRVHVAAMNLDDEYDPAEGFRLTTLIGLVEERLASAHKQIQLATDAAADRPTLAAKINAATKIWSQGAEAWIDALTREIRTGHPRPAATLALFDSSAANTQSLDAVEDAVEQAAAEALRIRYHQQMRNAAIALTGSAGAMILATLLMLALAKRIAGAIHRLLTISERIAEGDYENRIDETGRDEISRLFAGMAVMQRKLKAQIGAEREQLIAMGRVRAALDNVSGSVMMADATGKIIYLNAAMEALLRDAENHIRRDIPDFQASKLRDAHLDVFHRDRAHINQVMDRLHGPHTTQMSLGGREFRLTFNPVISSEGDRIGVVVEWVDRTLEVRMEREVQDMVAAVLEGNLAHRIDLEGKSGFFAGLGRDINHLADNIAELVATVKQAATEIHRGTHEIAEGNNNLSTRTEQQAASLEKTAASMEEMTSTVRNNADNASQASQLATAARDQAHQGGIVAAKAVAAMEEINLASRRIADIVTVIDDLAFQTNLLALNAAVEAARAGEQGRGFAVVAAEVRNLASRSATSARQIRELIQDSVKKVEDGSELITLSGKTLEQIVAAVKKVNDVISEIAMASREQSAGIEQVNQAVMQMDEMTQQNAALVEQATASSHSMTGQAQTLTQIMERYQVGSRSDPEVATPSPSVPAVRHFARAHAR
ncbi:MAG TPA: methyl-accepting chemotaxis protein [Steroidobacteraceae bacterium]